MFDYAQTMDKVLKSVLENGEAKGVSALVIKDGKEKYFNAFGYANEEARQPMNRFTIIRLFSMSKPVTAAATMLLFERGLIELWDPISKYLPEFKNAKVMEKDGRIVPARREITIWDLLNMTSGIPYPDLNHEPGRRMGKLFDELIEQRKNGWRVDTRQYIKKIAEIPLCFHPGEKWMYGLSADILGGIIEEVSGKRFDIFLKEELFDPLEMPDTGFFVPEKKIQRFAQLYGYNSEGVLEPVFDSHLGEYYGEDVAFLSGGAGLVSTLDDYSHFASMMIHNGVYKGKRILGRKTIEFMTQNRIKPEQTENMFWDSLKGNGYGCLMRVLKDQGEAGSNATLGEFGWDGWTGNYVTMDPADDLIILFFIQRADAGMTAPVRKIRNITYASLDDM